MDFPAEFLRGVPNNDFIEEEGNPASNLFTFEKKKNDPDAQEVFFEESINWNDDKEAHEKIFNQKKEDGKFQFNYGVVVLCRHELDRLISNQTVGPDLAYERYPIDDNIYHGNILLKAEIEKKKKRRVAAAIATICVKEVIAFER